MWLLTAMGFGLGLGFLSLLGVVFPLLHAGV